MTIVVTFLVVYRSFYSPIRYTVIMVPALYIYKFIGRCGINGSVDPEARSFLDSNLGPANTTATCTSVGQKTVASSSSSSCRRNLTPSRNIDIPITADDVAVVPLPAGAIADVRLAPDDDDVINMTAAVDPLPQQSVACPGGSPPI